MYPFLRIGRRQFLRNSALGLGVAPLIPGVSSAAPRERVTGNRAARRSNSNTFTMRATFGGKLPVWIVREPNSGFQQQLASRELARGLRNLGLVREPMQAVAGQGQPPAACLVFSLSTSRESIRIPESYEISTAPAMGEALAH